MREIKLKSYKAAVRREVIRLVGDSLPEVRNKAPLVEWYNKGVHPKTASWRIVTQFTGF